MQDSSVERVRWKEMLKPKSRKMCYLINEELVLEENIDLGIAGSPAFIGLNSVGISSPLVI
jgi:hypothetical protein